MSIATAYSKFIANVCVEIKNHEAKTMLICIFNNFNLGRKESYFETNRGIIKVNWSKYHEIPQHWIIKTENNWRNEQLLLFCLNQSQPNDSCGQPISGLHILQHVCYSICCWAVQLYIASLKGVLNIIKQTSVFVVQCRIKFI